MINILKGLYDQIKEPVVIVKDGETVHRNPAAMGAGITLSEELLNESAPFIGGTVLNETEYQINVSQAEGFKVYVFYRLNNSFKTMLSSIGSSIKNSLSVIQIAADKIELIDDSKTQQYYEAMVHQIYTVNRLAGNMLRLGGADYDPMTRLVDLVELYGDLIGSVNVLVNGGGAFIEFSPSVNELNFKGNNAVLERLLLNLLSNSLKATDKDGKITVRLDRRGKNAVITVMDNGTGIPDDIMPHLFTSYEVERSLSDKYNSLGFGLSVVYDMVRSMGGTLVIRNGQDKGAMVTVSLPIPESENVVCSPAPEFNSEVRSMKLLQTELCDILSSDCYGAKFKD